MKILLVMFALLVFCALVFFRKTAIVRSYRQGLLVVLLSAILVPAVVGELKTITNTACPRDLSGFNGSYPYIKLFEPYPSGFHQAEKMYCFPAGHASGDFALLSLFFLFKSSKNRKIALLLGMVAGWSTGWYKMLIGDHFLSHPVVTMLLAWLIILYVAKATDYFSSAMKRKSALL